MPRVELISKVRRPLCWYYWWWEIKSVNVRWPDVHTKFHENSSVVSKVIKAEVGLQAKNVNSSLDL
jgi:uncharacterized protein YicC (UPF0701 family)